VFKKPWHFQFKTMFGEIVPQKKQINLPHQNALCGGKSANLKSWIGTKESSV
jgi:hypothetical protein